MEMREIEAFLAVAELRHFGRAAQRLRVTTSHVSQIVRTLERRVGAPLFERTSRRVVLTALGEQLLAELRPAYQRLNRALHAAQQTARQRGKEPLRVGFSTSLPRSIPTTVIEAFERRWTHCGIIRSEHPGNDIIQWLHAAEFDEDVLVCWIPDVSPLPLPPQISVSPPIRHEPRAILMAESHPLADHSVVDIEELAHHKVLHPGLRSFTDGWTPPHTPAGRPIRRIVTRDEPFMEGMPDLLGNGDLLHLTAAPVLEAMPMPGLVTVPLTGLPPAMCIAAWCTANDNPWIPLFAETAAQTGADNGWTRPPTHVRRVR